MISAASRNVREAVPALPKTEVPLTTTARTETSVNVLPACGSPDPIRAAMISPASAALTPENR